jgi:hypothetical protein
VTSFRPLSRRAAVAVTAALPFSPCAAWPLLFVAGDTLAQDSDHQIRCMQLQQELSSAQGGGREELPGIDKQIQGASRVYQGTQAAMEDAGCFERGFLIFGRGLVRSPKCLKMNDQVEDARRQLEQLQAQRDAIAGGRGNRRRQAELLDALARNGCTGGRPMQQQTRRDSGGGGLFGWFGRGNDEEEAAQPEGPVYRSIDPNGRYRSVCVRTCDGFFFPVSYQTYANRLAQDATVCQSSCAAPAELYVYRNPDRRSTRPFRSMARPMPICRPPSNTARRISRAARARPTNTIRPRSRQRTRRPKPRPRPASPARRRAPRPRPRRQPRPRSRLPSSIST